MTFWLLLFKIKSSTRPPSTCIYIISYCRFFAFINVHEQMQRCLKQMGCCIWSIYVKFVNQLYFMGWETNEFARRRWEIQTGFRKNYFYHIRIQNIIENHFKIKTKWLKGKIVRQLLHECNLQYKSLLLPFTNVLFVIIFIQ